jgi:hypothetical protein
MAKKKPKPDPRSERGKGSDKYPTPKKGERLKCLGCTGRGIVPDKLPNIFKECSGCKGIGFIQAT